MKGMEGETFVPNPSTTLFPSSNVAGLIFTITTPRAPSLANDTGMAFPSPRAPPVTNATPGATAPVLFETLLVLISIRTLLSTPGKELELTILSPPNWSLRVNS
jgi:hypothetical protein